MTKNTPYTPAMCVTDLFAHDCIYKINENVESNIEGLLMLQYMVCLDMKLSTHSPSNQLPTNLESKSKYDATSLWSMSQYEHLLITEVINRHESIDIEQYIIDESSFSEYNLDMSEDSLSE
jgi:hypothetical protein